MFCVYMSVYVFLKMGGKKDIGSELEFVQYVFVFGVKMVIQYVS